MNDEITNENNNNNTSNNTSSSQVLSLNSNNSNNSTISSGGGRFLAIRNWLKQNRWRKKEKNSTSPLVIQEIQNQNSNISPGKQDQYTSPINTLDKKAMKKNAKSGKNNIFKKLNSDYNLNNDNSNETTATLTGVNTMSSCTNPSETNTPLKNLTNNSKIMLNSPSNITVTNISLNGNTPILKSNKIFTPITNGSISSMNNNSLNFNNDTNNASTYVNTSIGNNSPKINNNINPSPITSNQNNKSNLKNQSFEITDFFSKLKANRFSNIELFTKF